MDTTTTTDLAERVIAALRVHEAELRRAGICRLSLFGSVARGDDEADSDVDLLPEPVEKPRLRANIERDRRLAF